MEANLSTSLRAGPHKLVDDHRTAVATAVLSISAAIQLLALLVLARRVAGALERPTPVTLLLALALLIGSFAWLSRRLWRTSVHPRDSRSGSALLDAAVGWGPSLAMIWLTFGLSWPLERFVDWLVWMPLWVADALWRKTFFAGEPATGGAGIDRALGVGTEAASANHQPVAVAGDGGSTFRGFSASSEQGVILQQLTRFRDLEGQESIIGSLRADFAPGQRTTEVYVGFCPPFEGLPTVEVEQSDGPPARITVGQVLPHGARIDVRLNDDTSACHQVVMDLFACGCRVEPGHLQTI